MKDALKSSQEAQGEKWTLSIEDRQSLDRSKRKCTVVD